MDKVTQIKASTAMTPQEWLSYCESKPGNYQVYIGDEALLHYAAGFEVAWNAFYMSFRRYSGVRLVGAS
jgi:hypothetical protein